MTCDYTNQTYWCFSVFNSLEILHTHTATLIELDFTHFQLLSSIDAEHAPETDVYGRKLKIEKTTLGLQRPNTIRSKGGIIQDLAKI